MKAIMMLLLTAFIFGALTTCHNSGLASDQPSQKSHQKKTTYACPMHPQIVLTSPVSGPKCRLPLRALENESNQLAESSVSKKDATESLLSQSDGTVSVHIPDATVYDQTGKKLKFHTDLVKGKTVAINFIFTTCTAICPPLTATFRRVQQELGERVGRDVQLISVSV